MSFQDVITQRRGTATAIFHKFRTGVKTNQDLHLFVEGYDDVTLYEKLLSDMKGPFGVDWKTYVCLGKNNLDDIVSLYADSPFLDRNVLFIRDSDYDRFLGRAPAFRYIFLTCGYSVENYVCSPDVLGRFIRSGFGIDPAEVDIAALTAGHSLRVARVFEWMAPVVGAALYAIEQGVQLDLSGFDVRQLYNLIAAGKDLPEHLDCTLWIQTGLKDEHFNETSRRLGQTFVAQDAASWLRGKYMLECTRTFLKSLREELRIRYKSKSINRFNKRSSTDFSASSTFERLCTYTNGTPALRSALHYGLLPLARDNLII